jgi:hypothetical protein
MIDEKTVTFQTKCNSCIFAEFDDSKQINCDLDRLTKYQNNNMAIFDEETQSFVIETICNACRGEKWANYNLGKNLIAKVEQEIQISFDFFVLALEKDDDIIRKKLHNTIIQCNTQKIVKPKNIYIVLQNKNILSSEIFSIISEHRHPSIDIKLIRIISMECDIGQCIDSAIKKSKSNYCGFFKLTDNIPNNLLYVLNNIINNKLEVLSMVEPYNDFSGLIIQNSLYRLFGGNKNEHIATKIKEAATEQNRDRYIYAWEQLWNS